MATPTYAECWTQIKNAVAILEATRRFGSEANPNLVALTDTHVQACEGDAAPGAAVFAGHYRAQLASMCLGGRAFLDPHIADMGKAIASDSFSSEGILADLYLYMINNTKTVQSRDFTFGAVAANGSNVGTGTVYRNTKDRYDVTIEAHYPTVTTARVTTDSNSGTQPGREKLVLFQSNPATDVLEVAGSGARGELVGHAGDEILRNASFQSFAGTAAVPTDIPNWTSSTTVNATNYQFYATDYFRKSPEEAANSPSTGGTPYSLQMNVTETITQKIRTLGVSLSPDVPYVFGCRWRRDSSALTAASGTLVLRLGAETTTVAVSAQTGWQTLVVVMDDETWLRNFTEDDLDLMIDWTRTGGQLLIDDVFFGPMTQFDGLWHFAVGGATNWVKNDEYTFTDREDLAAAAADQVWTEDQSAGTFVDETIDFNDAGAGDVQPYPTAEAVEDNLYIGYRSKFGLVKINTGTAAVGGGTTTWEYWNGSAWTALSGVTDGTTDFTVTGSQDVTWTMPTDWAAKSVNGTGAIFYVRARLDAGSFSTEPLITQGWVGVPAVVQRWISWLYPGFYLPHSLASATEADPAVGV